MQVGRIAEIWRYPVKSMMGERLARAQVTPHGVVGDRAWAVRDEVNGGIRGAKKIGALMQCRARYPAEPTAAQAGDAEITLPDGEVLSTGAAGAAARLSEALGHAVTLWPLLPADRLDHYRRGAPTHADMEQELRAIFGREPGEPLPDLSVFPPEIMEFESPPGTYFDAFPLHLLTTASLAALQALAPESRADVRRFRPNLLIETNAEHTGFVESEWQGKTLRIGDLTTRVTVPCPRCVMTTRAFADLPKDPTILRTIVREAAQNLGVYANADSPATIAVGDAVELVE